MLPKQLYKMYKSIDEYNKSIEAYQTYMKLYH